MQRFLSVIPLKTKDPTYVLALCLVGLLALYSHHADQVKRLRRLLELPQRPPDEARPPVRFRRHLGDAEVTELVALYDAGATVYDLAERFGVHRDTVSGVVKQAGLVTRYHERTYVDLERAAVLEAKGLTLTEIAQKLGVGRTTLIVARREARGR